MALFKRYRETVVGQHDNGSERRRPLPIRRLLNHDRRAAHNAAPQVVHSAANKRQTAHPRVSHNTDGRPLVTALEVPIGDTHQRDHLCALAAAQERHLRSGQRACTQLIIAAENAPPATRLPAKCGSFDCQMGSA